MLSTVTFILGVKLSHTGHASAFVTDYKTHLTTGNLKVVNGSAYLAASAGMWQQDRAYINEGDRDSLAALLSRGQDPELKDKVLGEAKVLVAKSQGKFSLSPLGFQVYMEICPGAPVKTRASSKTTEVAKKDPNAPKRPLNAYMLYSAEKRAGLKEEHPELNHKDIMKALGEEWKGLSDLDKANYLEMQEEQKAKYKLAIDAYNKGTSDKGGLVSFD